MHRPSRTVLTAALTAVFLCLTIGGAVPAGASARSDWWRTRALAALNRFAPLDTGVQRASTYADAAGAEGYLYGWGFSATHAYLDKLYALRLPSGGWGLGFAYDAFNDGTINPADTVYSVTLSGHVGPKLLAAYKAGAVPAADVQTVVNLLMSLPRIPVSPGLCVAYSMSGNDANEPCVHNTSASVAAFLADAMAAGFAAPGGETLVNGVIQQERATYLPAAGSWPYMGGGSTPQDFDHNSFSIESMYRLDYPLGNQAAFLSMVTATVGGAAVNPLGHIRLAGLPEAPWSMSLAEPGLSVWCQISDQWRAEAQAYLDRLTTAAALAQFAYYAARNSRICG